MSRSTNCRGLPPSSMMAASLLLIVLLASIEILVIPVFGQISPVVPPVTNNNGYCVPVPLALRVTSSPTVPTLVNGLLQRTPDVCTDGYTHFDGRCFISSYALRAINNSYPLETTWADAQVQCQKAKGNLASFYTAREVCWVHDSLPMSGSLVGCKNVGGGKGNCYIGYNRNTNDGFDFYTVDDLKGGTAPDTSAQTSTIRFDRVPFLNGGFTPWGGSSCTYDYTLFQYSGSSNNCEPNGVALGNGGQSCVRTTDAGSWSDGNCDDLLPYVCAKLANCPPGFWRKLIYVGMPERYDPSLKIDAIDSSLFTVGLCEQCPAGQYHPQTFATQAISRNCFNCPAGRIGDAGATSELCSGACPVGFYCPLGSGRGPSNKTAAVPCSAGTYNPTTGGTEVTSCLDAPPGKWSPAGSGVLFDCNPGFCGSPRATTPTCTEPCPAGHSCSAGTGCSNLTVVALKEPQACGDNTLYAPRGSSSCSTVSPGFFTEGGTPLTRTNQSPCPPGHYCLGVVANGEATACPTGTFRYDSGASSLSQCLPCSEGYFCGNASTTPTSELCGLPNQPFPQAMYYCPEGTTQRLLANDSVYTTPMDGPVSTRSGIAPCTPDMFCVNGTARIRAKFATDACSDLTIPENSNDSSVRRTLQVELDESMAGFGIKYNISAMPLACANDLNQGIFHLDSENGDLSLSRIEFPTWLDYEACPGVRPVYNLSISALVSNGTQASNILLTCTLRITVLDQNDQPYFPPEEFGRNVAYRVVAERMPINTVVGPCPPTSLTTCGPINHVDQNPELLALDYDVDSVLRYSIVPGLGDAPLDDTQNPFKINSCTGVVTMRYDRSLSFTSVPIRNDLGDLGTRAFNFTVRVTDDGNGGQFSELSADFPLIIYVTDSPDPPILNSPSVSFTVFENRDPGQLIGEVTATDPDIPPQPLYFRLVQSLDFKFFEMDDDFKIRTSLTGARQIDFESTKLEYSIEIEVRDDPNPDCPSAICKDTAIYTISVLNTNDPPQFVDVFPFYVKENAAIDSVVCLDNSGNCVGSTDKVLVVDLDAGFGDNTSFSLVQDANGTFDINPLTGVITVKNNSLLNFEALLDTNSGTGRALTITVKATSSGLTEEDEQSTEAVYTIFIVDVNERPFFSSQPSKLFVLETAPLNSIVDYVGADHFIRATDPDNADLLLKGQPSGMQTLSYQRHNDFIPNLTLHDASGRFSVTTGPGGAGAVVRVAGPINYETAPEGGINCGPGSTEASRCYVVSIRVSDNGFPLQSAYTNVTIEVINVNDGPVFSSSSMPVIASESLPVADRVNASNYLSVVTDDDSTAFIFEIEGGTGVGLFDIDDVIGSTLRVSKRADVALNFEAPINSYTLVVRGYDAKGSKLIGAECAMDNLNSCGTGAFCQRAYNSITGQMRCFELCVESLDGNPGFSIPRKFTYFCDYGSSAPVTTFLQPTDTTLRIDIQVGDDNDPPYIVDSDGIPGPTTPCMVSGSASFQAQGQYQVVISQLVVTDEDKFFARAPFTFEPADPLDEMWTYAELDNATGSLSVKPNMDLEIGQNFTALIKVMDNAFPSIPAARGISYCNASFEIIDQNTKPNFPDPEPTSIPENAPIGKIVYDALAMNFTAIDPDCALAIPDVLTFEMASHPSFVLNSSSSQLTLGGANLDYESLFETNFQEILVVRVRDSRNAEDVAEVVINVLDVNEPPRFNNPIFYESVPENTTGAFGKNYSLEVFDPDVYNSSFRNNALSISFGCDASCPFQLVAGRLQVRSGFKLDFENGTRFFTIGIRVQDVDVPSFFATAQIQLTVTDSPEPPFFLSQGQTVHVLEGPGGSSLLNMAVLVSDPDITDPVSALHFQIISGIPSATPFQINNGLLLVAPSSVLDYEDVRFYTLNVTVTDTTGLSDFGVFSVQVDNVNDVTISSIQVLGGSGQLYCNGSVSTIVVTGTNFGLLQPTLPQQEANVSVTYGRSTSAMIFQASNCVVTVANTEIRCLVNQGGYGSDLFVSLRIAVLNTDITFTTDFVLNFRSTVQFPPPVLTSVIGASSLSSAGGEVVTLYGSCLGRTSDGALFGALTTSSFVRFCTSFEGCRALTSCSALNDQGTALTCQSLPGLGASLTWQVQLDARQSDVLTIGAYSRPVVQSISQTLFPTSGELVGSVQVNGTGFGGLGAVPQKLALVYNETSGNLYEYRLLECTVTEAYTQITCTGGVEPGVGRNLWVRVVWGGQQNLDGQLSVSFEAPTFTFLSGEGAERASTIGGQLVILAGTSFGPVCGTPGASVDDGAENCPYVSVSYTRNNVFVYRPTICAVVTQDTIVCATVEGTGAGHQWFLSVGGQSATRMPTVPLMSYKRPVVATYSGPGAKNALTTGGDLITIVGSEFGPVNGAPVTAVYGNELYDKDEFVASNCSVVVAHTEIRCRVAPGAGNELSWIVTVDDQVGENENTDYGKPELYYTNPDAGAIFLNPDGGEVIDIYGLNFGPPAAPGPYLQEVTMGPESFSLAYSLRNCFVLEHSRIRCVTSPGTGDGLFVWATVKKQVSDPSYFFFAYQPPEIYQIIIGQHMRTAGGDVLRVYGAGFALCDPSSTVQLEWVTVSGAKLLDIAAIYTSNSDFSLKKTRQDCPLGWNTTVEILVPEMVLDRSATVRVLVTSSAVGKTYRSPPSLAILYDDPRLDLIFVESDTLDPTRMIVTMIGDNFCNSNLCCQALFNGAVVPSSNVLLHDHTTFKLALFGTGGVSVRCANGIQTREMTFSSNSPAILGTVPQLNQVQFNTTGGPLTIWGLSFGSDPNGLAVLIGSSLTCNITTHESVACNDASAPSTVSEAALPSGTICYRTRCQVPAGTGKNLALVVRAGGSSSSADDSRFEFLSYKSPIISSIGGSGTQAQSSAGGGNLTITGSSFGISPGTVYIGSSNPQEQDLTNAFNCTIVSWTDTVVVCTVPPGEGANMSVTIAQVTGSSFTFEGTHIRYLPPSNVLFDQVQPSATQGGTILLVTGVDFGRPYLADCSSPICTRVPPKVFIGGRVCTTVSSNATAIFCTVPPGEGVDLTVRVWVAGQEALATGLFNYAPPRIFSISPFQDLPTSGLLTPSQSMVMTVLGENFGVDRLMLFFNGVKVAERIISTDPLVAKNDFLAQTNHTHLFLNVPQFIGANISVSVNVRSQTHFPPLDEVNISYALPTLGNFTIIGETGDREDFSSDVASGQLMNLPLAAFNATGEGLPFNAGFGSNRRRQRRMLLDDVISYMGQIHDQTRRMLATTTPAANGYGFFTSCFQNRADMCFGTCERSNTVKGTFWRVATTIAPNGEYLRVFRHYDLGNGSCLANEETHVVEIHGVFADIGASPVLACGGRSFSDRLNDIRVTPVNDAILGKLFSQCPCNGEIWTVGVQVNVGSCILLESCPLLASLYRPAGSLTYGTYTIADLANIYMTPTDPTREKAENRTYIRLSDSPIAFVADQTIVKGPHGPTEGCFEFEPLQTYLERARAYAAATGQPTTNVPRLCIRRALVELTGNNLGSDTLATAEQPSLRVFFVNEVSGEQFEAATTTSQGNQATVCPFPDCLQTHFKVRFQVPLGVGKSLKMRIMVGNQVATALPTFSYDAPQLREVSPGTIQAGHHFIDAIGGSKLALRGANFGGRPTLTSVLVNGYLCSGATWALGNGQDDDGRAYVTCDSPMDVVGPKAVYLCLAGQASVKRVFRSDVAVLVAGEDAGAWTEGGLGAALGFHELLRSPAFSRCPANYTGRIYELCAECPTGAICNTSLTGPESAQNFFGESVPIVDPQTGELNDYAILRCPQEQWNATLVESYPDLVQRETCTAFSACEPPSACVGKNMCATGYEYALYRCRAIRKYSNESSHLMLTREEVANTSNSCGVVLNPYTSEYEGVDADCKKNTPVFQTCSADHPEDCTRCVVRLDSVSGDKFGVCECTLPERCALCTIGQYFRLDNECQVCPANPGLLIAGLFILAIVVAFLGWFLSQKQVNLAFVTIGIDYFQVLAVVSTTKIPWPPAMKSILQAMSVFNFNIDIAAPECLVPNLEYEVKWWLTMSLPIALGIVLVIVGFTYSFIKLLKYGKDATFVTHVSALISTFVVAFYYLYLALTKRSFDVFNCNPVNPDDGFLYTTFTSLTCDGGGLCRCGDPNGAQVRLLPFAFLFLVLYSFGYPACIAWVLRRNSQQVKQDQYLRAHGVGEKRKTNPETYDLRKRFSKLYYQFRPRYCTFWILVLLARKFWIAFAALLFRGNPTFQLAVILLVLFASLVMQVSWRPYMSSADNQEVIEELEVLVQRASVDKDFVQYIKIHEMVQKSLALDVEDTRRQHEREKGRRLGVNSTSRRSKSIAGAQLEVSRPQSNAYSTQSNRAAVTRRSKRALQWFANLNTLEFILLSCGIFVCLAGIMFESSRNDRRQLVRNQAEFITWVLVIVVILSFIYYAMFFLAEIAPTAMAAFFQLWMRLIRRRDVKVEEDYVDHNVELEENPLFSTKRVEVANNNELEEKVRIASVDLREEQQKNSVLRDTLYHKKIQEQIHEQQRKSGGYLPADKTERQRKEFGRERVADQILRRASRAIRGRLQMRRKSVQDGEEEDEE